MKSVAIAAMMLVPAVTSAAAQVDYESSAWLLERCEARDGRETGFCMGYIAGVAALGRNPGGYCPSNGVTRGQLLRVVIKYLQEHPEKLHLNAAALILDTLSAAFPCK